MSGNLLPAGSLLSGTVALTAFVIFEAAYFGELRRRWRPVGPLGQAEAATVGGLTGLRSSYDYVGILWLNDLMWRDNTAWHDAALPGSQSRGRVA